jgi:putative transposase
MEKRIVGAAFGLVCLLGYIPLALAQVRLVTSTPAVQGTVHAHLEGLWARAASQRDFQAVHRPGVCGESAGRGKRYQAEQVVNLLRQIEVAVANGKTTAQACKEAGIVEQTYFRWRKEYGGLQVDQAKRLKELEQENAKLKRLVANLSLDNLVLKDFASGNF